MSVNFRLPHPIPIDEVESVRLEASKKVSIWAIQDAMLRGEISQDEAKERFDIIRANFDGMKMAMEKKVSK